MILRGLENEDTNIDAEEFFTINLLVISKVHQMRSSLILAFCVVFYLMAQGQKVNVTNIEEVRTTSGSSEYCKIDLRPYGDELVNYKYYKINEIKRAIDNKGTNLLPEDLPLPTYASVNDLLTVQLLKTSRTAVSISIDGSISLYNPTVANGGIVKISAFKNRPEINLGPKDVAYSVHYYDKVSLTKKGKIDYVKRQEDINKLPENERNFASEIYALADGLSYYSEQDLENILFFAVGGDNSKILGIEFEDAKGEKIKPASTTFTSVLRTYYFEEKPDPAMNVILNVESPKALTKIPFSVLGAVLP